MGTFLILLDRHGTLGSASRSGKIVEESVNDRSAPAADCQKRAVVLFSGGRDSSLAACLLARDGFILDLLTTFNGASISSDVLEYRLRELRATFPENIATAVTLPTYGLFRRLALASIEEDFAKYKKNLIPLGDALATHAEAVVYCQRHKISVIASGYTSYERMFPEQMPEAIKLVRDFLAEYSVQYLTPVESYAHADQVKYDLLNFGLSTKSLEGLSLFADTFSIPSAPVVQEYVREKLVLCRDYISFRTPLFSDRRNSHDY